MEPRAEICLGLALLPRRKVWQWIHASWDGRVLEGLRNLELHGESAWHSLLLRCGIGQAQQRQLEEHQAQVRQRCEHEGIRIVAWVDGDYPSRLQHLYDAPWVMYGVGAAEISQAPGVAIVGSRCPTEYGLRQARRMAAGLVDIGVQVISGHATGIDEAAHYGALEAGGRTIAYLGGPHEDVKRRQPDLYHRIAGQGLLLSEYPPGTPVQRWMFPERNRLVAAHAFRVLVVQATHRSGTAITARLALELGRDVAAVPGDVESSLSELPHRLLQEGAMLATDPWVLCEGLGAGLGAVLAQVGRQHEVVQPTLSDFCPAKPNVAQSISIPPSLQPIVSLLNKASGAMAVDELVEYLDADWTRLSAGLLELELLGCVRSVGGGRYTLC